MTVKNKLLPEITFDPFGKKSQKHIILLHQDVAIFCRKQTKRDGGVHASKKQDKFSSCELVRDYPFYRLCLLFTLKTTVKFNANLQCSSVTNLTQVHMIF